MPKKKKPSKSPAMDFLVATLKKRPSASYAEIAQAAAKKRLKIYPVMFGRAQTLVGIVKAKPRGSKKKAVASGPRRGRPPTSGGSDVGAFLRNYEDLRVEHERLREAVESIQREIGRVLR
jgi:hypothetical protein